MPASKLKPAAHNTSADTTRAVEEFMATLVHPHKAEVEALRELVLSVDPSIFEGIKWNAPSFRTTEYFATTNLRAKSGIRVIQMIVCVRGSVRSDIAHRGEFLRADEFDASFNVGGSDDQSDPERGVGQIVRKALLGWLEARQETAAAVSLNQ